MTVNDYLKLPRKPFKIVAVSSSRGAFGHNQFIILAENGEAWKVLHIQKSVGGLEEWSKGDIIHVPFYDKRDMGRSYMWYMISVECPEQLPKAPQTVVKQVWG